MKKRNIPFVIENESATLRLRQKIAISAIPSCKNNRNGCKRLEEGRQTSWIDVFRLQTQAPGAIKSTFRNRVEINKASRLD